MKLFASSLALAFLLTLSHPSAGQTSEPAPLTATRLNNGFRVNPALNQCTVASVDYSTPLDCAIAFARQYAASNKVPVSLELDAGTYETKVGFQGSTSHNQSVNIRGAGKSAFGGGTTVKLIAPLTTAVITYPPLPKEGGYDRHWYDLRLEGFGIDANGMAPSCFKLYALGVAHLDDLGCRGATASGPGSSWVQIGGLPTRYGGDAPDGYQAIGFQVMANDIFVYHNAYATTSKIGATIVGGHVTAWPVLNSGNFREPIDQLVVVKGPNAGIPLCSVMPTNVLAHMIPDPAHKGLYKIGSVTSDTPGSGCSGTASIGITDMAAADYGFRIAATDSTFRDLTDDSVGRVAAISDRGSAATTFYGAHVFSIPTAFEVWGGATWNDSEVDLVTKSGFYFRYGSHTIVNNTKFVSVTGPAYGSVADYVFNDGVTDTTISGQSCNPLNPNPGYVQFVGTTGAFDLGYGPQTPSAKAAGIHRAHLLPTNLTVRDAPPCVHSPTVDPGVAIESPRMNSTLNPRTMSVTISNLSAAITRPILIAELPPYIDGQGAGSGLRITVSGGAFGAKQLTDVMTLRNGSKFFYSHKPSGDQSQRGNIPISAWRQEDGSVKIYAQVDVHCSSVVTVDMVLDGETHLEPAVYQETATGTSVFNSGDTAKYSYESP